MPSIRNTALLADRIPDYDLDFTKAILDKGVVFSRSSAGTYFGADGLLKTAAVDEPRFWYENGQCIGFLSEQQDTNWVLWCRDWTNAAWVKVNMTAALDQTGIDGASNTATKITATAANATILQTIGTTQHVFSFYAKRITGTGTIQMTLDAGATWTNLPALSTSEWTRVSVSEGTTGGLVTGVRIVTSGDEIAVDYGYFNSGVNFDGFGLYYSPISTTSATVTRAADVQLLNMGGWISASQGSCFSEKQVSYLGVSGTNFQPTTGGWTFNTTAASTFRGGSRIAPGNGNYLGGSLVEYVFSKTAMRYGNATSTDTVVYRDGVLATTPNATSALALSMTAGISFTGGSHITKRVKYWRTQLTQAELQKLTV